MCVYNFFLPISFPLVYKNGLHFTVYIQSNLSSNIFLYININDIFWQSAVSWQKYARTFLVFELYLNTPKKLRT